MGTAGLRIAGNRDAVIATIAARTGVRIEVVSGEEESRLAYLAVKAGVGLAEGSLAVFDTGGGSTQLTFGQGERVDERFSVDVGAVRYTEQFGLDGVVTPGVLREAMAAIAADLGRLDGRPPVDALVGMGGAITNITAVKHALAVYDPDVVQGTVLDRAEIDRQIELYRTTSAEERRSIVGLQPKRADVILAGACIVGTVMDKLGRSELTVSDRGLRHGLLAERFGADPVRGRSREEPMATKATSAPTDPTYEKRLTDEELRDMMQLVKGADSVELKVTVPRTPTGPRSRACRWTPWRRSPARSSSSTRRTSP